MLDDFAMRAALAGLGVALAAAPLGCFVVWRRMAYFGDATSHAALLGVALALATDLPVVGGVLLVALMMALIISTLTERNVSTDALLGVLAHSALALGLGDSISYDNLVQRILKQKIDKYVKKIDEIVVFLNKV